jgi:NTE family protein
MAKRALVMSGGGAKGAFELGAIDYLVNDRKLDFDVVAGVSVGSLNAVLLAQGQGFPGLQQQVKTLKDVWFGIRGNDDIYRGRFLGKVLVFLTKDSEFDPAPIRDQLARFVDEQRLKTSGKQFRIGAVSLESGDYVSINQDSGSIADWTLASSSMPVAFPPVAVRGEHAVDGGVRNVTPFKDAFAALKRDASTSAEPDEMYVLLASPLGVASRAGTDWKNGLVIAERAVELLVNEVFREDLAYALDVNASLRAHAALQQSLGTAGPVAGAARAALDRMPFKPPKYRLVDLRVVLPEREYMDALDFDPAKIKTAFAAGRTAAQRPLDEAALRQLLT